MSHLSVPVVLRVVATLDIVLPPNDVDMVVALGKKRVKTFRLWRYFNSTITTSKDPVVKQVATVGTVSLLFNSL